MAEKKQAKQYNYKLSDVSKEWASHALDPDTAHASERFMSFTASIAALVLGENRWEKKEGESTLLYQQKLALLSMLQVNKFRGQLQHVTNGQLEEEPVGRKFVKLMNDAYASSGLLFSIEKPSVTYNPVFPVMRSSLDFFVLAGPRNGKLSRIAGLEVKTYQSSRRGKKIQTTWVAPSGFEMNLLDKDYGHQVMQQMMTALTRIQYLIVDSGADTCVAKYNYTQAVDWWNTRIDTFIDMYERYLLWYYEPTHKHAAVSMASCNDVLKWADESLLKTKLRDVSEIVKQSGHPKNNPEAGKKIRDFLETGARYISTKETDDGLLYEFVEKNPSKPQKYRKPKMLFVSS